MIDYFTHGPVSIRPATSRDLFYIAANMRPSDWEEIRCQLREDSDKSFMVLSSMEGIAWTAWYRDQPIAAFGFTPLNCVTLQAWAWGTKRFKKALPAMMAFKDRCLQDLREAGYRRIEARSLATHTDANPLLEGFGAEWVCDLHQHGKGGETFILWELLL